MDILYGRNPVLEALRAHRPARKIVIAQGLPEQNRLQEILERASVAGIAVESVSRRRLDDIAHTEHHQGVVGYFHAKPRLSLDDLIEGLHGLAFVLVLDGVQDPHNLGALARTAEVAGVDGIVISQHHSVGVTAAVVKASAGATEHLPVVAVPSLNTAIDKLKAAQLWCIGLDAEAQQRYDRADYTSSLALCVGGEGEGLRPAIRRRCDVVVAIPMVGKVASLNAAVAGAILMYEVRRQRQFTS